MNLTWQDLLIYSFIPFSDLYLRVAKLNGSIDKMWTLFPLFQLPIFSLVPLVLMKYRKIKRGNLSNRVKDGKPYDIFIILFILFKYIVSLAANKDSEGSLYIDVLGTYIAIVLPLVIRHFSPGNSTCISTKWKSSLFKSFGQGGIIYLAIISLIYLIPKMRAVNALFGENFMMLLLFIPCYIITNLINENNIKNFCHNDKATSKIALYGFVSLILVGKMLKSVKYDEIFSE
jgi:hypothetical protein